MKIYSGLRWTIAAAMMCGVLFSAPVQHATHPATTATGKSSGFTTTAVKDFNELMALSADVRHGRLSARRVIEKIRTAGLAFTPTKEQVDTLRSANTNSDIVDLVAALVPVAPPKPTTGTLMVFCEPVECAVTVNGKPAGTTEKGRLTPLTLPVGSYAVRASAMGFQTDHPEQPILIDGQKPGEARFTFKPTHEALQAAGHDLYNRVVSVMGGGSLVNGSARLTAAGTMNLWDRDGKESTWNLKLYYSAPDTARFDLERAGESYIVTYTVAGGYNWGKNMPPSAPSLEDVLFRLCRFQAAVLLKHLGGQEFTPVTNRLTPIQGQNSELRLEGSPDTYVVQIDPLLHMQEVKIESTGLNKGIRALYGDYAGAPDHVFPHITQVLLPDAPRHGVEFRCAETVYNSPEITAAVFSKVPNGKAKKSKSRR